MQTRSMPRSTVVHVVHDPSRAFGRLRRDARHANGQPGRNPVCCFVEEPRVARAKPSHDAVNHRFELLRLRTGEDLVSLVAGKRGQSVPRKLGSKYRFAIARHALS